MNRNEFKREYNNVAHDVEAILQKSLLTRIKEKMKNILSLFAEIPKFKDKKLDKQLDITL